ncbi:hypothetical protein GCM10009715_19270 [Paeniglutamicibacter psychrophenolicus]
MMTGESGTTPNYGVLADKLVFRLLVAAPAWTLAAVTALYLFLLGSMPQYIARHAGPDGIGYSSTTLVLAIIAAVSASAFAIGGATAHGFLKAGHWYQTEKMIAVGIVSLGYGVAGIGLATMLATVRLAAGEIEGDAIGVSMVAFVLAFIAAAWTYTLALPPGELEQLGTD